MPQSKDETNEIRDAMRPIARVFESFLSFFFAVVGTVFIARGLEVARGPLISALSGWTVYHLDLSDTFLFYSGCAILAASLTFLWSQRFRSRQYHTDDVVASPDRTHVSHVLRGGEEARAES